jgi:hypothetical protein
VTARNPAPLSRGLKRYTAWRAKPSVRNLARIYQDQFDRLNSKPIDPKFLLPDDEKVSLGGIILFEVFTPSTSDALREMIERLPSKSDDERGRLLAKLANLRQTRVRSWHWPRSLGVKISRGLVRKCSFLPR